MISVNKRNNHFVSKGGDKAMQNIKLSRATLGRIPVYLRYLKSISQTEISATAISRELGLGEVLVRKDLNSVCGTGKPKVGYSKSELIKCLEKTLGKYNGGIIIVGAGKLGKALLDYNGFSDFGLSVLAAFDKELENPMLSSSGNKLLPMSMLKEFCSEHNVKIGIIAVPSESAQEVFNELYENGVKAVWCFAPCRLYKPADAVIQYENMALSLAHLTTQIK